MQLEIRPATVDDLPGLERMCWRNGETEMRDRIERAGTCAIIGLDDGRPVAQLYIRAYQPGFRSQRGMMEGDFWADLKGVEPDIELPGDVALLGCWHVGRTREPDGEEREAEQYRGRGVGVALLKGAIEWLNQPDTPFGALAVKATDSEARSYIGFVGALPRVEFETLGFECLATFDDPYFVESPENIPAEVEAEHPERFHLMLLKKKT